MLRNSMINKFRSPPWHRTTPNEGADRVRGRGEKRGREGGEEGEGGGRRGGGRREKRGREEGEEGEGGGRRGGGRRERGGRKGGRGKEEIFARANRASLQKGGGRRGAGGGGKGTGGGEAYPLSTPSLILSEGAKRMIFDHITINPQHW